MQNKATRSRILVVDDDRGSRSVVTHWLSNNGFDVIGAVDGCDAITRFYEGISLIVTDLRMPRVDGIQLLRACRERLPHVPVIVLTGEGSISSAIEALKLGAFDYLTKPVNLEELLVKIHRAMELQHLNQELAQLHTKLKEKDELYRMIGRTEKMRRMFERIRLAADSDATVLVTGESGTGKELVARALHAHSRRAEQPFLPVNFAALSESLIESELFGHEAGSFTGAINRRDGVFQAASGGTLFLDEIGELRKALQSKLLRALENRTVMRVGSQREEAIDVRMVAATNCNLESQVERGKFREDLYYRLNVIPIELPPLRDRLDDIPLLAQYFAQSIAKEAGRPEKRFTMSALERLCEYNWPGNVRELKNTVERLIVLTVRDEISPNDLPPNLQQHSVRTEELDDHEITLQEMERRAVAKALAKHQGHRKETARSLGISVRTLQRKIHEYKLKPFLTTRSSKGKTKVV